MMRIWIIGVIGLIVLSCGSEQETGQVIDLNGKWVMKDAQRDGRKTQTLKGAYFQFTGDDKMSTNIMGSDVSSTYERSDRKIVQQRPREIIYIIDHYADSTMTLKTELRGTEFEFLLKRVTTKK